MTKPLTYLLLIALTAMSASLAAQEDTAGATIDTNEAPIEAEPQSFADYKVFGEYLRSRIEYYQQEIETLTRTPELKKALAEKSKSQLAVLAEKYKQRLDGSLKVRLYPAGTASVDYLTAPACGYACVQMIQNAAKTLPPAEALLHKTPEANITLVHGVSGDEGQNIGAIVVHYPYTQLGDAIKKLVDTGLYVELRQSHSGKPITLLTHGDKSLKEGAAQKFLLIKNTRWSVGVWTPGGVAVDDYEQPTIPLMQIAIGAAVGLFGLILLVVFRAKRKKKQPQTKKVELPKAKLEDAPFLNPEAALFDDEEDKRDRTVVMGGGAAEVDVSAYLKKEDITDIKKKLIDEDVTEIKKKKK